MRHARRLATPLVLAAMALLLAACGGETNEDTMPSQDETAMEAPQEEAAPPPAEDAADAVGADEVDADADAVDTADDEGAADDQDASAGEETDDGDAAGQEEAVEDEDGAESAAGDEAMADAVAKLNLNEASAEDFATVPGVGDRMVREFLEYRPYVSIAQFRREIGKYVDESTVAGFEEHVFVPVDPNASDEATLMQLPGVDAEVAAELAAGRPYADVDAFIEALAGRVGAEPAEQGRSYVYLP